MNKSKAPVLFYDPHPGIAGAGIRLPESICIAAKEIDGREMEISDAMKIIQDAADILVIDKQFGIAKVKDEKDYDFISLSLVEGLDDDSYPKHSFRVIRYK